MGAQSAMSTCCTELHGPESHRGCTALHGLEKVYCIVPPSCEIDQTIHLARECMDWKPDCGARRCTEYLVANIARHCTEPMQHHCQFHVGARLCTQFPDNMTYGNGPSEVLASDRSPNLPVEPHIMKQRVSTLF